MDDEFDRFALVHMLGYLRGCKWRDAIIQYPAHKAAFEKLAKAVDERYGTDVLNDE